jgi:hypothetical protein
MAGSPKGNKNAKGNRGGGATTFQDRELAARVRSLALSEIESVLTEKKDKELYKAVLIKLAGSVLPRLNEVSGPDGGELKMGVLILPNKDADLLAATTKASDSAGQT